MMFNSQRGQFWRAVNTRIYRKKERKLDENVRIQNFAICWTIILTFRWDSVLNVSCSYKLLVKNIASWSWVSKSHNFCSNVAPKPGGYKNPNFQELSQDHIICYWEMRINRTFRAEKFPVWILLFIQVIFKYLSRHFFVINAMCKQRLTTIDLHISISQPIYWNL